MRNATALIGAAWGDEGKGLMTDYHSDGNTMVVRFNGGAQAGHTVCRNGHRHVFHHFGSGSLRGASTFLSRFFINNPILFFKELDVLRSIGCEPKVIADPTGMVTTPFDMMINQIIEESRGNFRHGSCGVGVNETIKRDEAGFFIRLQDLCHNLKDRLIDIQKRWVPERLNQLDVTPSTKWLERLNSKDIMNAYIEHCNEYTKIVHQSIFDATDKKIVFEGAQGLLLDEDHYFFPHVTHSHTGLKNVITLANEAKIDTLDVIYVTRAYATRHGAGPFPREVANLFYKDQTNVHNSWQGSIRFGHLDIDLLTETIQNDLVHLKSSNIIAKHGLAITCMDQVNNPVAFWYDRQLHVSSHETLMQRIVDSIGAKIFLSSSGPTPSTILDLTKDYV